MMKFMIKLTSICEIDSFDLCQGPRSLFESGGLKSGGLSYKIFDQPKNKVWCGGGGGGGLPVHGPYVLNPVEDLTFIKLPLS